MLKRLLPSIKYLFTGKAPIPIQKKIFKYLNNGYAGTGPLCRTCNREINIFNEFGLSIQEHLSERFLPDFLNPEKVFEAFRQFEENRHNIQGK